ncbi:hypothetical protein CHGG_09789 [Chaetomium globosum CBS 148.51]|uniref:Alcohol dehydrogenase-like N-terminal domain-containing protein n=1 Tax=Chaetomium globosum (strain ATCC 6205 / CBS 148.51 / DSM 1962 / NBRC 6347 / NRRL 1970) TaxID=306901 RepID=Q2GQG5_CHAGB|nr:uncharacterized protein CHGG_09789 [Chaetomium globosum CBS 148.51]EAQ83385.1 hypothetical protein CHGG_09789 [Chaetomium globosum CBS 148.51]
MKEALVSKGTIVQIVDSPVPTPNDDQVLIKVIVSGCNPKDWKLPDIFDNSFNQGDDIAGIVEKVGANVFEFKPGDRVAAFHEMRTPGGSYADPGPPPQHPLSPTPLIIYGAATAVGTFAIQLAQRSNIHPLLCVAGRASAYVSSLLDPARGDAVIDYRGGDEAVVSGLVEALQSRGLAVAHVLDAVAEGGSIENVAEVLRRVGRKKGGEVVDARVTFVLGGEKEGLPEGVDKSITLVGDVHNGAEDFGYVYYRYFARGLQEGWFKPQRSEVVPGGLGGVQTGLRWLKEGKASGVKYVFRIGETEGVER